MNLDDSTTHGSSREQDEQEMPYSLVFFLRSHAPLSEQTLQSAAEGGWGRRFDGKEDPMYFVSGAGQHAFVKAGKHVVKLLSVSGPYLGDPDEIAAQLPQPEQQSAWRCHRAWMALDYWNLQLPKSEAYEVLARLGLQLLDDRCCGIFLPKDEMFMPNDGTAREGLKLLLEKALL